MEKFEQMEIIDLKKVKKTKAKKQGKYPPIIIIYLPRFFDCVETQAAANNEVDHQARYELLLKRITEALLKNNPTLAEKNKILIKPPNLQKLPKKVNITNFGEICKQLEREENHAVNFFLSELGAEGSLAAGQLTIKNKLNPKQVESLFKKYITEYVQCQLCKGQKTKLEKDKQTRLEFLHCMNCQSQRSVAPIKKRN